MQPELGGIRPLRFQQIRLSDVGGLEMTNGVIYKNLLFTKQMVAQRERDRVKSNTHTHTRKVE